MENNLASVLAPVLTPVLTSVLDELKQLEPLIYVANNGKNREHFEKILPPDFWEVGASGKIYDRDFVLTTLEDRYKNPREEAWHIFDLQVKQIESHHYLFTYSLQQPTRLSRRATLWKKTPTGWEIVYHQGTPVL